MLLDFKDILSLCEPGPQLHDLYMHLEPKKVVSSLIVSPDAFEAYDIYDYIYENYLGYASPQQLDIVTDHIDHLYKAIHEKINRHIQIRHANDTYILHRWVTPTTALIGGASRTDT